MLGKFGPHRTDRKQGGQRKTVHKLASLSKWVAESDLGEITKRQKLLRAPIL